MIFIPGMPCAICGKKMMSNPVAFPPITANRNDPLWILSDAGVHQECYNKFPHKNEAEEFLKLLKGFSKNRSENGCECSICHERIVSHDDFFGLGYLTIDKSNPLYEYNFLQLHIKCIPKIHEVEKLLELLKDLRIQSEWSSDNVMNYLINTIEKNMHNKQ